MDYENKHPILQKLEDYFKNTPKEQIDKDWSNILKETDPESYYERKYKKALEWMQSLYSGLHGATKEEAEHYFPELKESEDEIIRKTLIEYIKGIKSWNYFLGISKEQMIAWLEKQGENKHTDKVEPKFKVGDWITNGDYIWKIVEVASLDYILQSQDGNIVDDTISYVDKYFRLWSIQDAKDGDVLNSPSHRLIWIYNDNEYYHVCINMNYGTIDIATYGLIKIPSDACPATKDERTILFSKMKEAGYEWDADKKEVKKNEVKKEVKILDADKVIEWLKNTISETKEYFDERGIYYSTHLILPYNSIEDLINDFKEDFGL